ncbi:hypothetical protein ScPMuIL_009061 [Solemya velum]
MGVDVTTAEMKSYIDDRLLGPSGYAYATNWNGYVLIHPSLHINGYVKDPPNVDFLDIEIDTPEKEELRASMINGSEGKHQITAFVRSPDQRHLHTETRNYYYSPIKNTSFSMGLSIPVDHAVYVEFSGDIRNINISKLEDNATAMLIAPWDYYAGMLERDDLTGTMLDIVDALYAWKAGNTSYIWNETMLLNLYWDVEMTVKTKQYWNDLANYLGLGGKESENQRIDIGFVGTHGGLTRVYPPEEYERFMSVRDTWKADYFRRALLAGPEFFLFMAPFTSVAREDDGDSPNITVVSAARIEKDNIGFTAAVAGAVFSHTLLIEKMQNASVQPDTLNCRDINNLSCYLLDDGAFLIATNQMDMQKDIGRFFGRIDPVLMWNLMNTTYHRLINYDYQAICQEGGDGSVNAGPLSIKIPSINTLYEVLSFNWWTGTVSWSLLNFNIYNWLFSKNTDYVMASDTTIHNVSCIKKSAQYYLTEEFAEEKSISDIISCGICSREFHVVKLKMNNLIWVVAEPECPECDEIDQDDLPQESVPVEDEPDLCEVEPRYRRRPEGCYSEAYNEDETKCGASFVQPSSQLVLISSLLIVTCIMWITVNIPS